MVCLHNNHVPPTLFLKLEQIKFLVWWKSEGFPKPRLKFTQQIDVIYLVVRFILHWVLKFIVLSWNGAAWWSLLYVTVLSVNASCHISGWSFSLFLIIAIAHAVFRLLLSCDLSVCAKVWLTVRTVRLCWSFRVVVWLWAGSQITSIECISCLGYLITCISNSNTAILFIFSPRCLQRYWYRQLLFMSSHLHIPHSLFMMAKQLLLLTWSCSSGSQWNWIHAFWVYHRQIELHSSSPAWLFIQFLHLWRQLFNSHCFNSLCDQPIHHLLLFNSMFCAIWKSANILSMIMNVAMVANLFCKIFALPLES